MQHASGHFILHRVAIIGAGIGADHVNGYASLPEQFHVTTICDINSDLGKDLASSIEARYTAEMDDILCDPEIDIVDICLPPSMHVPVAIRVLEARKHAIIEKPFAGSLAEADQLVLAAKRSSSKLFPVFQYRFGKAFDQLTALQQADALGQPLCASLETHWKRDGDYYANPWRGTWKHELGGVVLSHAIHAHDLLTEFFGPVANVAAFLTTNANPIETEDCAAIMMQMNNGALATSSITLGAAVNTTRIRLVYEHLTAESGTEAYSPGTDTWQFITRDSARQREIDSIINGVPNRPSGFAGFFQTVAEALAGKPGRSVTIADGVASIELVSAIYHSDRSAASVSLPLNRNLQIVRALHP